MADTYGTSKTSMSVERISDEKLFIGWVGDQSELLLDTTTSKLRKVHIFTTTLGFISLAYTDIFPDEKLPHFIAGTTPAGNATCTRSPVFLKFFRCRKEDVQLCGLLIFPAVARMTRLHSVLFSPYCSRSFFVCSN